VIKVTREAIEDLAVGAAIMGTGGGGDPFVGKLMCLQLVEKKGPISLLSVDELPDDSLIIPSAAMGTPTVLIEKIPSGYEAIKAFRLLEGFLGKKAFATCPIEAGGVNSTIPMVVGGNLGIPVVDADGMGRAFPELQQVSFTIYGIRATPMSMADEKGNSLMFETIDNIWTERIARAATIKMGGTAWIAFYHCSGRDFRKSAIAGTVSQAISIGQTMREARREGANVLDALLDSVKGYLIFKGKIVNVERANIGGFARGEARIEGLDDDRGNNLIVRFQNENLVAEKNGEIIASVPDLISVLDWESFKPITTERLRYGFRVAVISFPCSDKWRTAEGLKLVGPRYFGYDVDYVPIEARMRGE